jgi:hypothetical protein
MITRKICFVVISCDEQNSPMQERDESISPRKATHKSNTRRLQIEAEHDFVYQYIVN